jgi:hypothetical protein
MVVRRDKLLFPSWPRIEYNTESGSQPRLRFRKSDSPSNEDNMGSYNDGVAAASGVGSGVLDAGVIMQKYAHEAQKRVLYRPEGLAHYADLRATEVERLHALAEDPWADHDALNAREPPLKDGDKATVVILGGGFGALLAAVRLIQHGFDADDIRFVDSAGGFGGTWYWNRYPGK